MFHNAALLHNHAYCIIPTTKFANRNGKQRNMVVVIQYSFILSALQASEYARELSVAKDAMYLVPTTAKLSLKTVTLSRLLLIWCKLSV